MDIKPTGHLAVWLAVSQLKPRDCQQAFALPARTPDWTMKSCKSGKQYFVASYNIKRCYKYVNKSINSWKLDVCCSYHPPGGFPGVLPGGGGPHVPEAQCPPPHHHLHHTNVTIVPETPYTNYGPAVYQPKQFQSQFKLQTQETLWVNFIDKR